MTKYATILFLNKNAFNWFAANQWALDIAKTALTPLAWVATLGRASLFNVGLNYNDYSVSFDWDLSYAALGLIEDIICLAGLAAAALAAVTIGWIPAVGLLGGVMIFNFATGAAVPISKNDAISSIMNNPNLSQEEKLKAINAINTSWGGPSLGELLPLIIGSVFAFIILDYYLKRQQYARPKTSQMA